MMNTEETKRKEILFRKFTLRKCSNHREYVPNHRHITIDYFEPHKKLIQQMQKQHKKHQKVTDKSPKAVVTLARIEKKWYSLSKRLRKLLGT